MDYIQQPHRSWESALKGIDISDYKTEPAVSEPGSVRSFGRRGDDASSVISGQSAISGVSRRSTATHTSQVDSFVPGTRVVAKGLRDERTLNGLEGVVVNAMSGEIAKVLVDFGGGIGRRGMKLQNLTRLRTHSSGGGSAAEGTVAGLAISGVGSAAGTGVAAVAQQRKSSGGRPSSGGSAGAPSRAGGAARPNPGVRPGRLGPRS